MVITVSGPRYIGSSNVHWVNGMNVRQKIFFVLFAPLALCPPAFSSGVPRAQQSAASVAATRIDGFDVEVIVRLQGGGSQVVFYPAQPSFKVDDKVRVAAGALVLDQ
jgi:hypothetical protein